MATRKRIIWTGALLPVVLLLAVVAAWAIDTGAAGGEVLRNVELAGDDIGGLGSDDLLDQIEGLRATVDARPVRIETPEVSYDTTGGDLGLTVDPVLTAQSALDEGRTAILPVRPLGWLVSFVRPHEVTVHYSVDATQAASTLRRLEGDALASPKEPTIESLDGGPFQVVSGSPGSGIDADALSVALAAAAQDTPPGEPVEVQIRQTDLSPRLEDSVAETAAARANSMTATTMSVTAGTETIQFVPRELRQMVEVQELENSIAIGLSTERVQAVLDDELSSVNVEPASASITLTNGTPTITPSVTGVACCAPGAADAVADAFAAGTSAVTVDLAVTEPDLTTEEAEALGIVEEVGSPDAFGPTTNFKCCQNRVTNIQRIADIVRGAIIKPGEKFSVNSFVGQRTIEKGFVTDGVIYDGVLTEDVGGGVSQFATTLFNAALYAGLDFGTYQSHSLYISRYPRGHEATISFPHPDLEIVNSSQFGVMLWPTYTDTSITVRVFSTNHIDVAVGDPTSAPSGNCTRWTTPRTRTYPDGTTQTDTVAARYRPAEGVDC